MPSTTNFIHKSHQSSKTKQKQSLLSNLYSLKRRENDARQKEELEGEHRVVGVIGNHMDVLTGRWNWQSKRLFKLPSLNYSDGFGLQ